MSSVCPITAALSRKIGYREAICWTTCDDSSSEEDVHVFFLVVFQLFF